MVVVLGVVVSLFAAPPSVQDVQRSTKRVLDADYQQALPGARQPERASGGQPERYRVRAAPRRRRPGEPEARGFLGTAAVWLIWVIAGIVVIVFVAWGARELLGYTDDASLSGDDRGEARDERHRVVARPLARAEELAADGRFGEAIRALLLRTLAELVRATPGRLQPSLTSREILAAVAVADEARNSLAELVHAVEISHFGGKEPGAAEYSRCLDLFQGFASSYVGAARA